MSANISHKQTQNEFNLTYDKFNDDWSNLHAIPIKCTKLWKKLITSFNRFGIFPLYATTSSCKRRK